MLTSLVLSHFYGLLFSRHIRLLLLISRIRAIVKLIRIPILRGRVCLPLSRRVPNFSIPLPIRREREFFRGGRHEGTGCPRHASRASAFLTFVWDGGKLGTSVVGAWPVERGGKLYRTRLPDYCGAGRERVDYVRRSRPTPRLINDDALEGC